MSAQIITIGDELLQGFTIDTNSAWIGQKLLPFGISVERRIAIPDELEVIISTVKDALAQGYQYIFVTGGLGPTRDDITKSAFKHLFKTDEYFDEDYYTQLTARFAKRKIKIPDINRSQATMLTNCDPIPNRIGTALGMHFRNGDSSIFVLPGVPSEMKSMVQETIIPDYLPAKTFDRIITLQTTGISESQLAEDIRDILDTFSDRFGFAFLPHHTGVNLRIKQKPIGSDADKDKLVHLIIQRMGTNYYGSDGEPLEKVVGQLLIKMGKTLSVAESCTGGLISKILTDTPGSSDYFAGSIISYSNALKHDLLGVPEAMLTSCGAVSEPVAKAMAEGCRFKTGTDFAISVTGISGPGGGSAEKPVGLVYIALASEAETIFKRFHLFPQRKLHREMTAVAAIDLLRRTLIKTRSTQKW